MRALLSLLLLGLGVTALAGPYTTHIVSFELSRYDGQTLKAPPNFRRGQLNAVIEDSEGHILTAPLLPGRVRDGARIGTASFEGFELDHVFFCGIQEATPGAFPDLGLFNGVKVIAYPESGARLLVRRLGQLHPLGSATRRNYRVFPQMGTKEAIPPVTKVSLTLKASDGLNSEGGFHVECENIRGELGAFDIAGPQPNNTQRTFSALLPIKAGPGELHRVILQFSRGFAPYRVDEYVATRLIVEAGDPDLPLEEVYSSGSMNRRFSQDDRFWQSPVLAKRRVSNSLTIRDLAYRIWTGSDDLRVETGRVDTSSRLIISAAISEGATSRRVSETVPDEMAIRRRLFERWAIFDSNLTFEPRVKVASISDFVVESVLGGFDGSLKGDQWEFDGLRLTYADQTGARRILFSNFERHHESRSETLYKSMATQNDYITDQLTIAPARLGIPLPGLRVPSGG